ncbi:MAG: DNA gyrase inhibitor YacG [Gammaproteobacteria bacterium]
MSTSTPTVRCPNCREKLAWSKENEFRPFCSKRCRLIDLGEWFNENHRIAGEEGAPMKDDS